MKGSEFVFDYVHLFYYKCHKINFKRSGSYIESPGWIITNYWIKSWRNRNKPWRIPKINLFINKYNWEGINFSSEKDDQKNLRKIIDQWLSMFCMLKKKKTYPACVSKHYSNYEKQVIILLNPNGKWWHDLAVKKLSILLGSIRSKHHGDFYCLNCFHSFATESNREPH